MAGLCVRPARHTRFRRNLRRIEGLRKERRTLRRDNRRHIPRRCSAPRTQSQNSRFRIQSRCSWLRTAGQRNLSRNLHRAPIPALLANAACGTPRPLHPALHRRPVHGVVVVDELDVVEDLVVGVRVSSRGRHSQKRQALTQAPQHGILL